jgi:hypothetical protein
MAILKDGLHHCQTTGRSWRRGLPGERNRLPLLHYPRMRFRSQPAGCRTAAAEATMVVHAERTKKHRRGGKALNRVQNNRAFQVRMRQWISIRLANDESARFSWPYSAVQWRRNSCPFLPLLPTSCKTREGTDPALDVFTIKAEFAYHLSCRIAGRLGRRRGGS